MTRHYRGMPGSYEAASLVCYPMVFRKEPSRDMIGPQPIETLPGPFGTDVINSFDIEAGATVGILLGLSVHVGFSPGQFADFLLGWFGADIAGDDHFLDQLSPFKPLPRAPATESKP
jgi:hypothetical protein